VLNERSGSISTIRSTRSEWSRRPLTRKQIANAQLDYHYLIPVDEKQREELVAATGVIVDRGVPRRSSVLEPPAIPSIPTNSFRLKGAREAGPARRQALRELFVLAREPRSLGAAAVQVIGAIARRDPRPLPKSGCSSSSGSTGPSARTDPQARRGVIDAITRRAKRVRSTSAALPKNRDDQSGLNNKSD